MNLKKLCAIALACVCTVACLCVPAAASGATYGGIISLTDMEREMLDWASVDSGGMSARASAKIDVTLSANQAAAADSDFPLGVNDTVTLDCTYTPSSASIDFGLIAPDGYFYYINSTSGSIHRAIQVSERGYYTLAVRNNSSFSVSVVGYVNY